MGAIKTILLVEMISLFVIGCSDSVTNKKEEEKSATEPKMESTQKSLPSETNKRIGNAQLKINYTAPAVRGRVIWGELVPYNKVWVTGAHMATRLEINKAIMIGDTRINPGKYAIFTIPTQEDWTVIINKNWEQHQADEYNEADDVIRVKVKPEELKEPVERLTYEIDQTGEKKANISMSWEKRLIRFGIQIVE